MDPAERDKTLDELVTGAIGRERLEFDFDAWKREHRGDIEEWESKAKAGGAMSADLANIWRMMMHKGMKIAAVVAVVVGVVVGLKLAGGPNGSGAVFAKMAENLQTRSYTFNLSLEMDENSPVHIQVKVLEPGRMRFESPSGAGSISSITDMRDGKSLLLFHAQKAAQIMENPVPNRNAGVGGMFALCLRPVESLWDLRDGTQKELGVEEIAGQEAAGFKVYDEDEHFTYEMTIWGDIETGRPVLVEIVSRSLDDAGWVIKWTMRDFGLDAELSASEFSLKAPAGYTLAHQLGLEDIGAGTETSAEGRKIEESLGLWSDGRKSEALEILLGVDWTRAIGFSQEPYVLFAMTEKGYISLRPAEQKKAMTEIMAGMRTVREIAKELVFLGQQSVSTEDYEQAERYFTVGLEIGRVLTGDRDRMIITRLLGLAVEKMHLREMIRLYKTTSEQEQLKEAERQLKAAEARVEEIKRKVRGG